MSRTVGECNRFNFLEIKENQQKGKLCDYCSNFVINKYGRISCVKQRKPKFDGCKGFETK